MWERYAKIIERIEVGEGILPLVPQWVKEKGFTRPLVVADENTYKAAGAEVSALLEQVGIRHDRFIYRGEHILTADETAIGALCAAYQPENDLILGAGSGTINDLCKFVGYRVNRPCAIVGTAPSMDGYSAKGAAMTVGGMKITPQTQCPSAIFCDINILKNAPMPMLAAGLGDMLGKLNALADWKLSHLLTGEPMPEDIAGIMSAAVQKCRDSAADAARRDAMAIRHITEGLILSGIAMSLYGDSRPASGAEHHLAHYWEMRAAAEGREPVSHGLKVGVATIYALRLWKSLPDLPLRPKPEDRAGILEHVKRAYGAAADALIPVLNPNLPFEFILNHWDEILKIARETANPEDVTGLLKLFDAPTDAQSVEVNDGLLRESIVLARERKKTYTILQLFGDLGLLEICNVYKEEL